jgi:hypothetical protein
MILAGCVCKDVDWMQDTDESELVWQELPNVMIFRKFWKLQRALKL